MCVSSNADILQTTLMGTILDECDSLKASNRGHFRYTVLAQSCNHSMKHAVSNQGFAIAAIVKTHKGPQRFGGGAKNAKGGAATYEARIGHRSY